MENNMKMEVAGKLKKHFNSVQKQSNTSPGVSVLVVSTHTLTYEKQSAHHNCSCCHLLICYA